MNSFSEPVLSYPFKIWLPTPQFMFFEAWLFLSMYGCTCRQRCQFSGKPPPPPPMNSALAIYLQAIIFCLCVCEYTVENFSSFSGPLVKFKVWQPFLCLRPVGRRRHYVFGLSVRPYGNLVLNTKSQEPLGEFLSYLAQGCTMTSRWTD